MQKPQHNQEAPEIFSTLPIFQDVDDTLKRSLDRVAILRSYKAGQIVCFEGDPCEGFYVVKAGWLKSVKIAANGREQIFRFIGPGETYNEVGLLTDGLNQTTLTALEPTEVWIVSSTEIHRLMGKYPILFRLFSKILAKHVHHLMNLVENLSLFPVESRLARIFLEHSTGDVLNRRKWSTQTEMAARLGTVPDVLNRALRGLAEEGLIQIERQRIHILDRRGLERKAMLGD